MANYEAYARSNYFKIKSVEEFKRFCAEWHLDIIHEEAEIGPGLYGFLIEDGGIPNELPDHEDSEGESESESTPRSFSKELASQLAEGEVAIVTEVGREGLRYLVGYSLIINWNGDEVAVSLETETMKLAREWNAAVTAAGA